MSEADRIGRALRESLPAFLPTRRWFGDKSRPIDAVAIVDLAETGDATGRFWLTVVDVRFADGGEARYFVPVAARQSPTAGSEPVADLVEPTGVLLDAFDAPEFLLWALDPLARSASIATAHGRFAWSTLPDSAGLLALAARGPVRRSSAEQSNSSVRYGDAVFMKVFRRLRAGVDCDEEIGRFLATRTPFRRLPTPLGTGRYVGDDGSSFPLVLAQAFVPSVGDGWSFTLGALADGDDPAALTEALGRLGRRTGELHLALANGDGGEGFDPVPTTAADAASWEEGVKAALAEVSRTLIERETALPASAGAHVAEFSARVADFERRAAGFRSLVGGWRTRVHGDFHLGQTLRTPDADWVVLDFEGEPARSIEERRAKTSPLKDVAGMLRSFGYAAGAALRNLRPHERNEAARMRLAVWEAAARGAFLAGYRTEIGRGPIVPVPTEDAAFEAGLAAWELGKALYEVAYELANRPDWIDLPLRALLASEPPAAT